MRELKRYKKRPLTVEAIQHDGSEEALEVIMRMSENIKVVPRADGTLAIEIPTRWGVKIAEKNDWIVRGVQDELYPFKPNIFDALYEEM